MPYRTGGHHNATTKRFGSLMPAISTGVFLALVLGIFPDDDARAAATPPAPANEISAVNAGTEVIDYGYRVVSQRRFDRENFTQGLEFHDGRLYVSSGGYGQSMIRVYDFPQMTPLLSVPVDPRIFAEGLTIIDNQLILLSWRERVMLVYSLPDLTLVGQSPLPGQGWGATHQGSVLWFSDGSDRLYSADLAAGGQITVLPVRLLGKPVRNLNELEWVDGEIWANVWQTDRIVRIQPDTGEVTGVIDLTGLLPEDDRLRDTDVLNGIARHPETGALWVTGKNWPWLYEIALEKKAP